MKKCVGIILTVAIALSLAACGSSGESHIYDKAKIESVLPGTDTMGTYSLLEIASDEVTDEALTDWYFNYVEQTDCDWCVIHYTDTDDNKGVYAKAGGNVCKDTYLDESTDGTYRMGDNLYSTQYRAENDELVVFYGSDGSEPEIPVEDALQELLNEAKEDETSSDYLSRRDFITYLMYDGYPAKEVAEAINNCDADWYAYAVKDTQFLDPELESWPPPTLIKYLEYDQFTQEEIDYAMENSGVDWNEIAVANANMWLSLNSDRNRDNIIQILSEDGFTEEQANYGADHCDGSWNK